ncbi:Uncharacterised protein [Amycolatopsis camponoti]|uniref:Uncharacterized protein n=1 Tax=Amycolatopsis camponoti TaxID=2606593 RepID=A0A6I8M8L3_9PSEU|nr:Uncharacterised protein [Amycolatopsis camponoti]
MDRRYSDAWRRGGPIRNRNMITSCGRDHGRCRPEPVTSTVDPGS